MLSYDAQFCHKCAIQGLPFSTFDHQLYVMTLDVTAAKVSAHRCFQCQHFNHEVINCPLPLGAPLEKDQATKKAAQGQQGQGMHRQQQQCSTTRDSRSQLPTVYHQGREICIKFQSGPTASPAAEGPMCAGNVSRTTQLQNIVLQAQ